MKTSKDFTIKRKVFKFDHRLPREKEIVDKAVMKHNQPKPRAREGWERKIEYIKNRALTMRDSGYCGGCQEYKKGLYELVSDFESLLSRQREEILPTLYSIRANIPLTYGLAARKKMKELIESLEAK